LSGDNGSLISEADTISVSLAKKKINSRIEQQTSYENSIGLPPLPANNTDCSYLELTHEEISKMSAEQCGEAAGNIASYAIYIQRILNKERSILRWLEARINLEISPELNSYTGYYSNEHRRAVAITNNAYAKELEEMRITSQMKVDMLEGLPYQMNQLCKVLLEVQATKRGKLWHGQH
jgi:hypothetical protein